MSDASEALRLDAKNITALSVRARLLAQNAQSCVESGLGDEDYPFWDNASGADSENDDVEDSPNESGWLSEQSEVASALQVFFANLNEEQAENERPIYTIIGKSVSSAIQFVAAHDAMTGKVL